MRKLYRRYTSLDGSQRRLVVEAAALVAAVAVGLRVLRFLTFRRILDRYLAVTRGRAGSVPRVSTSRVPAASATAVGRVETIDAIRWAIAAVARRMPSATCLVQALAADAMLRRRGIIAELRFGVRRLPNGDVPIEGHAWVECEDGVTIGADDRSRFTVLTEARPQ